MGALFNNVCYPTAQDARVQSCSALDVKAMSGTNLYTSECTSTVFTTANMTICKRTNGGVCTNVAQPWPVTPYCDHEGGVTLAYDWFLLAVVLLSMVYGAKQLLKLFENNTIES